MWAVSCAITSLATLTSLTICCTDALEASIFTVSMPIFSVLSDLEVFVLPISRSHQFLWSSSSFCSAISLKIIFWIMLLTASKGPPRAAATSSANCSKLREWAARASSRRRFTARCLGSAPTAWTSMGRLGLGLGGPTPASRKDESNGDVGNTGFVGASVRTPVTFARMSMAAAMACNSCSRMLVRSVHSDSFRLHAFVVSSRLVSSASSVCCVSSSACLSLKNCSCVSPRSVFFSPLASVETWIALSRADFARL
mmetsp:Transcript_82508/g.230065  ORF Transcript_82508/g.230065 Transcript_82508/m.230065 type:complete len:255 (+) Transcript_82508:751-1515(+)